MIRYLCDYCGADIPQYHGFITFFEPKPEDPSSNFLHHKDVCMTCAVERLHFELKSQKSSEAEIGESNREAEQ